MNRTDATMQALWEQEAAVSYRHTARAVRENDADEAAGRVRLYEEARADISMMLTRLRLAAAEAHHDALGPVIDRLVDARFGLLECIDAERPMLEDGA